MDTDQSITRMEAIPFEISKKEQELVEAKRQMDISKAILDKWIAIYILKSNRKNATEKKAAAEVQAYQRRLNLIDKTAEFEGIKLQLNQLKNEFDSVRKRISWEMELLKLKVS